MNLFLGNFVPQHDQPALWQLDSDYFLHTGLPIVVCVKIELLNTVAELKCTM